MGSNKTRNKKETWREFAGNNFARVIENIKQEIASRNQALNGPICLRIRTELYYALNLCAHNKKRFPNENKFSINFDGRIVGAP